MLRLPRPLLILCCKELKKRDDNFGQWPDSGRHPCFEEVRLFIFREHYSPIEWMATVESLIKMNAVIEIAETEV